MKVEDMRIDAQIEISMTVDSPLAIRYVNQAIRSICDNFETGFIKDDIEINATKDTFYPIHDDCVKVKKVTDEDGYKINSLTFELDSANQIKFSDDGKYTIEFLRYPANISNATDIPEINVGFHSYLYLYIASKARSRIYGKSDQDSIALMDTFLSNVLSVHRNLSRKKSVRKKIKAPSW